MQRAGLAGAALFAISVGLLKPGDQITVSATDNLGDKFASETAISSPALDQRRARVALTQRHPPEPAAMRYA